LYTENKAIKKELTSVGLTYIHTWSHLYGNVYMWVGVAQALADSSHFRFSGEQSSQKWVIPCLGCQWITHKNL